MEPKKLKPKERNSLLDRIDNDESGSHTTREYVNAGYSDAATLTVNGISSPITGNMSGYSPANHYAIVPNNNQKELKAAQDKKEAERLKKEEEKAKAAEEEEERKKKERAADSLLIGSDKEYKKTQQYKATHTDPWAHIPEEQKTDPGWIRMEIEKLIRKRAALWKIMKVGAGDDYKTMKSMDALNKWLQAKAMHNYEKQHGKMNSQGNQNRINQGGRQLLNEDMMIKERKLQDDGGDGSSGAVGILGILGPMLKAGVQAAMSGGVGGGSGGGSDGGESDGGDSGGGMTGGMAGAMGGGMDMVGAIMNMVTSRIDESAGGDGASEKAVGYY
jgi:hypothetical protein